MILQAVTSAADPTTAIFGVLGGSAGLLTVLGVLGNLALKRVRGATPYEALDTRIRKLEEDSAKDQRSIRILANGYDISWRLVERMTEKWGSGEPVPTLTSYDAEQVRLARNLVTYGDADWHDGDARGAPLGNG